MELTTEQINFFKNTLFTAHENGIPVNRCVFIIIYNLVRKFTSSVSSDEFKNLVKMVDYSNCVPVSMEYIVELENSLLEAMGENSSCAPGVYELLIILLRYEGSKEYAIPANILHSIYSHLSPLD